MGRFIIFLALFGFLDAKVLGGLLILAPFGFLDARVHGGMLTLAPFGLIDAKVRGILFIFGTVPLIRCQTLRHTAFSGISRPLNIKTKLDSFSPKTLLLWDNPNFLQ